MKWKVFSKSPVEVYLSHYPEKFWRDLKNYEIMPPNSGCDSNGHIPTTTLSSTPNCPLFTKTNEFLLQVLNFFFLVLTSFCLFIAGVEG